MHSALTRRELLAALAACGTAPARSYAASPPAAVAIGRARTYGDDMLDALGRLFDQLGGLGRLVKGKTVLVKINLTGNINYRLGHLPAELTHYSHPRMIGAVAHLMGRAGARRILIAECPWSTADPLEEVMLHANWDPSVISGAAPNVGFVNTNWLGNAKEYARFFPPNGGYMFRDYELHPVYRDCDVFVSLAKLKEHGTCGVTLALKNCFGTTPCTIYGDGAGENAPSEFPTGGRHMLHDGSRHPPGHPENDPHAPREGGYRVPRVVADLTAARPIHLAIIDGIATMAGGEGPWIEGSRPIAPGLVLAGTNPVSTDAVAMAVMGFDPMAARGAPPFETCDSHLALAEKHGAGTRNLARIDLRGVPLARARFEIRAAGISTARALSGSPPQPSRPR